MWIAAVIAMITALIGFASLSAEAVLARGNTTPRATMLAENMASYRAGVIRYASANPGFTGTVTTPIFPTGHITLNPQPWTNQVLADGTVVIHATALPATSITGAISALSHYSVLAGQINLTTNRVQTPGTLLADQATLPAVAGLVDGVPIWLGHRE